VQLGGRDDLRGHIPGPNRAGPGGVLVGTDHPGVERDRSRSEHPRDLIS